MNLKVPFLLLLSAPSTLCLAPPRPVTKSVMSRGVATTCSTTALNAMSIPDLENESAYRYMLNRARAAAFKASTTSAEARQYLHEILHMEEGCISGTLTAKDLCEDVQETAEIVAHLRQKADQNILVAEPVKAVASLIPFGLVLLVSTIYAFSIHSTGDNSNVIPFTAQEWVWSIRDGYFGTLWSYFAHHGGMPVMTMDDGAASLPSVVPFTPQEWIWSIQGGYLPSMLSELYQNGGLVVGNEEAMTAAATPFSREEWMWAMQGGYFDNMLAHYIRNGGL